MIYNTKQLIAALLSASVLAFTATAPAHPQDKPHEDAAIENSPADPDEPTLDDLLGLDDEDAEQPAGDQPEPEQPDPQPGDDEAGPELTRDLERRLSGEEAATQFAQAIQEMAEVAIRLDEENDPGIDTQRMQDEIILKLEQIISSAEKQKQQQQQQQQQGQPGPPRQADQGGQPKPGQQQGQQQNQQPGQQAGQQQAQGKKPGDGEQQADLRNPNATESGDQGSRGSVRNEELTMQELRDGEWGNLPPRLRDELAESLSETFNPVYRAATEAFYRRIAELSKQQAEGEE